MTISMMVMPTCPGATRVPHPKTAWLEGVVRQECCEERIDRRDEGTVKSYREKSHDVLDILEEGVYDVFMSATLGRRTRLGHCCDS